MNLHRPCQGWERVTTASALVQRQAVRCVLLEINCPECEATRTLAKSQTKLLFQAGLCKSYSTVLEGAHCTPILYKQEDNLELQTIDMELEL